MKTMIQIRSIIKVCSSRESWYGKLCGMSEEMMLFFLKTSLKV